MKTFLPWNKSVSTLVLLVSAVIWSPKIFGQTTIVNYNFNAGTSFAALAPTLATGITSTAAGSAAFGRAAGVATRANAFTANATAGEALSSAANNSWTFTLGGANLANYTTFKIYFEAERLPGGANTISVAYSLNGGAYTNTGIASTPIAATVYGNAYTVNLGAARTWYEAIFSMPTAADNPTSLAFQLTIGAAGTGAVRLDNFEVQAELPCVTPATQPTSLALSATSPSSIAGTFSASVSGADGYLVVESTGSSLSANPVNGTVYTTGEALGGGVVVQEGAATSFSATGLTSGTLYYFYIFAYNNTNCSGGPDFLVTGPLTGNAYPACTTPTAPTLLTFPTLTTTSIGGSFTAASGPPSGYLIIVSTSSTLSSGPAGGTNYSVGNSIGGGTVLQVGTGTTFTLSPASENTLYYFFVYAYNTGGPTCGTSYSTQLAGSSYTSCVAPTAQPTGLNLGNINSTSITGTFTAASPAPGGYLVVRTTDNTAPVPVNGTVYPVGATTIGTNGYIEAAGTSTTWTSTGLTPATQYFYWVYSYSNCSTGPIYLTTTNATLPNNNIANATTLNQKNWIGIGAGGPGADFNTATNWSPAVVPGPTDDAIINWTVNATNTITMSAAASIGSLTITDNTAPTFAFPATHTLAVLTNTLTIAGNLSITNNAVNAVTSEVTNVLSIGAGGTLVIDGNLTLLVNSNTTSLAINSAQIQNSGTMTVSGTTLCNSLNGRSATSNASIHIGNSPAITTFNGPVTFDDGTSAAGNTTGIGGIAAGATGTYVFNSDLILGPTSTDNTNFRGTGTVIFDGTGSQTITDNSSTNKYLFPILQIGNANSPAVTIASGTVSGQLEANANLTINGTSTLVINAGETFNSVGAAATLLLNTGATLELPGVTGGQTGSNFPTGFTTVSLQAGSTVEYDGTAAQTVYSTPTYGNLTIGDVTLVPSSYATAGGALTLAGNLLINPGANFVGSTFSHIVQGNWTNNGSFSAGAGSTVSFTGNTAETIGGSSGTVFNNLTINQVSPGSITLATATGVTVGGALTLTNGIVTSAAGDPLTISSGGTTTGATNNSYVNGPVNKVGSSDFVFPVGKIGTAGYVPIAIANLTGSTTFTAEYIRASATKLNPSATYVSGLSHVSNCEYWTLEQPSGGVTADITGYWASYSPCNGEILSYYINDLFTLVLAHFDGANWNAFGPAGTATNTISNPAVLGQSGQVSWTGVSSFSPFSLGSTITDNPLPVGLTNFNAVLNSNKTVGLTWTTQQEENLNDFEIERSADGIKWVTLGSVLAKGNSALPTDYGYTDQIPLNGANYYRLRMINQNGDYVFSLVQVVTLQQLKGITVFPNPANSYLNVTVSRATVDLNVKLINQLGEVLQLNQVKAGTSAILTLDVHNYAQGTYFLQVSGADGSQQTSKVVIMR